MQDNKAIAIDVRGLLKTQAAKVKAQLRQIDKEYDLDIQSAKLKDFRPAGPDPDTGLYQEDEADVQLVTRSGKEYLAEVFLGDKPFTNIYDMSSGMPLENKKQQEENILDWE
jgi:hypothetical protein